MLVYNTYCSMKWFLHTNIICYHINRYLHKYSIYDSNTNIHHTNMYLPLAVFDPVTSSFAASVTEYYPAIAPDSIKIWTIVLTGNTVENLARARNAPPKHHGDRSESAPRIHLSDRSNRTRTCPHQIFVENVIVFSGNCLIRVIVSHYPVAWVNQMARCGRTDVIRRPARNS